MKVVGGFMAASLKEATKTIHVYSQQHANREESLCLMYSLVDLKREGEL